MNKLTPEEAAARVREIFGTVTEVKPTKPVSESINDSDADVVDLLTRVCYFYPQYTLETAEKLADSQVVALLIQAEKQRAIEFYNYALIAAAPHSKKGEMVKKLINQYKSIVES